MVQPYYKGDGADTITTMVPPYHKGDGADTITTKVQPYHKGDDTDTTVTRKHRNIGVAEETIVYENT